MDAEMLMNLAPSGTDGALPPGVVPMKPTAVRATPDSTAPSSADEDSEAEENAEIFTKAVASPQKWVDSKLWSAAVRVPLLTVNELWRKVVGKSTPSESEAYCFTRVVAAMRMAQSRTLRAASKKLDELKIRAMLTLHNTS